MPSGMTQEGVESPSESLTALRVDVNALQSVIRKSEAEWFNLPDGHPLAAPGQRHLYIAQAVEQYIRENT